MDCSAWHTSGSAEREQLVDQVRAGQAGLCLCASFFPLPLPPLGPCPPPPPLETQVLTVLRKNGFAVLEGMVPAAEQLAMEAAAVRHFETLPEGYFTSPLRADRSQVHVPYEAPNGEKTRSGSGSPGGG